MDMETIEVSVPASRLHTGIEVRTYTAGDQLRIQEKPSGEPVVDLLDYTCPAGKTWSVQYQVTINEVDL